MISIRQWMTYLAHQVGIIGLIGLAVLAAVTGYYLSIVQPLEASLPKLRAGYFSASRSSAVRDSKAQQPVLSRSDAFQGFFPPQTQALGWVRMLYQIAEREKLQLVHGEYRAAGEQGKSPLQLQIMLPVRGSYAQIRSFVTGSLAEIPFLALDEIDFQRSTAGGPAIEAKMRFTLYMKGN